MARPVALMKNMRNTYKILVLKSEGKRSFERLSHRWKEYFKIDLKEISCGDMARIPLAQSMVHWRSLRKQ